MAATAAAVTTTSKGMNKSLKKIEEAINSIPEKKENLRKALESLQPYSSSLAAFTLQWKDLEDHFAAIEKCIDDKFKALQDKEQQQDDSDDEKEESPASHDGDEAAGPTPRPELRSLCASMDAKGLRAYISDNRTDLEAIREELAAAIRCAPDPALLVLEAMEGFYPHKPESVNRRKMKEDGEIQMGRRICINLLDKLHLISPNISPSVREKAKNLSAEWRENIPKIGDSAHEVLGFLHLIASYKLVSDFPLDDVMDLLVSVARRKQAVDLIKSLGLVDKLPDLIQKLNSKGRQLDAVKFICSFDMVHKFPPVPLLKAYISDSKKTAQEVRKKGNNSLQAQNEAAAKETGALKSVLKAIEEYKLENEYPRESLTRRLSQLEQKKALKKRTSAAAASSSKPQQKQSNKRPRPSSAASTVAITANPYPPSFQPQAQLGVADRMPYMGMAGPYGLAATSSVYNHGGPDLFGTAMGHGGSRSPPRVYYASDSLGGTSGLFERPATYGGYTLSSRPSSYGSLYP